MEEERLGLGERLQGQVRNNRDLITRSFMASDGWGNVMVKSSGWVWAWFRPVSGTSAA